MTAPRNYPPYNFDCEHCGKRVPWAQFEGEDKPRNHCPYCLWSKHIEIGKQAGYLPCGAMMRGVDVGNEEVVWRCLGCGFMMRAHTDDYIYRTVGTFGYAVPGGVLYIAEEDKP